MLTAHIENACEALDREASRLEGLPASEGARRQAAYLRALEAEWRGILAELDSDSPHVARAAATAQAYLVVYG